MNLKLLAVSLLLLSACAHASFESPREFAKLDEGDSRYDERATSARGVVIAVREVDAPENTSLGFWSEAITQRLQAGQGYALLDSRDVKAKTGQAGRLLGFGHDQNGHTYDYWVAVFPQKKSVVVLEAGGRRDHFEKAKPELEKAIASLELH